MVSLNSTHPPPDKKNEQKKSGQNATPREEIVLLALYNKELYGLQIPGILKEVSHGAVTLGVGSLYPILHSLENKGFVESRWGDDSPEERGGARRRYYKLTESGSAAIERVQSFRNELLHWSPC